MSHETVAGLVAPWLTASPIDAIRLSVANKWLHREIDVSRCQFRTGTLEPCATFDPYKKYAKQLVWSPCGRYIIGSMTRGCITAWSTETQRILMHLANDPSMPLKLDSVSAEHIIATTANNRVRTWSLPSFQQSDTDYSSQDYQDYKTSVSMSRGMLIRTRFSNIDITRLATNETYRFQTSREVYNCAFTHDTTKMVSMFWANGPFLQMFDLNAARDDDKGYTVANMASLSESFDKEYVLASRSNRAIISNAMNEPCIVNFDTGAISITMFSHAEFRDYGTCAWSRDDMLLAVNVRSTIYIVSTATREIVHRITLTGVNTERMCFSPDSRRLAVMAMHFRGPNPKSNTMQVHVIDIHSETVSFE